jgi:hypothetical protein
MKIRHLFYFLLLFTSTMNALGQTGPEQDVPHVQLGALTPSESDGHKIDDKQTISRDQILHNPILHALEQGYRITGFTFSIEPAGGATIGPFTIKGDKLTNENLALIGKQSDAVVYFRNITFERKGQTGTARGCYYRYH